MKGIARGGLVCGVLGAALALAGPALASAPTPTLNALGIAEGAVGIPQSVAVSPNGELLYIANENTNGVLVADVSGSSGDRDDDTVIGSLSDPANYLDDGAGKVALSPDGDTLYIAGFSEAGVAVANVSGVSLTHPGVGKVDSFIDDANAAQTFGLAVSPDGKTLYLSDFYTSAGDNGTTVSVVDISGGADSDSVVGTVADSFDAPAGLALTPDGRTLYVVNEGDEDLDAVTIPQVAEPATPTISGTADVGDKLTAKSADASVTYQWYAGGTAVEGATKSTLTLSSIEYGKKVTVTVTAGAVGYSPASATSAATVAVGKGLLTAHVPKISGKTKVGATLRAKLTAWKPAGVKLSYQWYAGTKKLKGADKVSLKLTKKQAGKKIRVVVTSKKTDYKTVVKKSKATKTVTK